MNSEDNNPIVPPPLPPPSLIGLPSDFHFSEVDATLRRLEKLEHEPKLLEQEAAAPATPDPPLGVLSDFNGTFTGTGFNTIFRPANGSPTTTFPNPVNPPPPVGTSDNVLELNVTTETLDFTKPLGSVPNRGFNDQNDIFLNGVTYMQVIEDTLTGKGIHVEPGIWMNVPASQNNPNLPNTLCRMASIPHGTTINAQGAAPTSSTNGPPNIPAVNITPFAVGTNAPGFRFPNQTLSDNKTLRIPQDLSKLNAAGTITQAILDNPNQVLVNANAGKIFKKVTEFTVSTKPTAQEIGIDSTNPADLGGGSANISFLKGTGTRKENADATQMSSTFWISTVEYKITVPKWKTGDKPLRLFPNAPNKNTPLPVFAVNPPKEITAPKVVTATAIQIQYSQNVLLNFNGLSWPHISVATLVPAADQPVPDSAFN